MNSFGTLFKVSIYGASHDCETGVIVDGCPSGIPLKLDDFIPLIDRRRPDKYGGTNRTESDSPLIRSGVYKGFTTGVPINVAFKNENINSGDYNFDGFHRPGHADFTASVKYDGFNNPLGGGQFSGRMTLPLVAAGVIAMKIIPEINISAELILANSSSNIEEAVMQAAEKGDSIGGVVKCTVKGIPAGWGEPFFDSVESLLSHAIFAIPGVKALAFGDGFESVNMSGSSFNDAFIDAKGTTKSNHSGGINGGIANGNDLIFSIYIRPTSSISLEQQSFNFNTGSMGKFSVKGRHDVCFAKRVPAVAEAVTAIVLADLKLRSAIYKK